MNEVIFIQIPFIRTGESGPERAYSQLFWLGMSRIFSKKFVINSSAYSIKEIPYWATILSAVLKELGISSRFLDTSAHEMIEKNNFENVLFEFLSNYSSGNIFALSPYTSNYPYALQVKKSIRKFDPGATVLVGGPHASHSVEECLADGFDIVFSGPGEGTVGPILTALLREDPLPSLHGVSFLNKTCFSPHSPGMKQQINIAGIRPDYNIIPPDYRLDVLRIFSSYGCPFRCCYCGDALWNQRKPITKPIDALLLEIHEVFTKFGKQPLLFGDENFTFDMDHTHAICSALTGKDIEWYCQTRVDLVSENLLREMAHSGCKLIHFGAESASIPLLNKMGKNIAPNMVVEACRLAKKVGLNVLTYWMVGVPGETIESAESTLAMIEWLIARRLTDFVDYYICVPYPGSYLNLYPDLYDVKIRKKPYEEWREDRPSVMYTESLSEEDIYRIWQNGLNRIVDKLRLT